MRGWNRTLFFDLNVLARPPPSVSPQTCQVWGAILPAVHPQPERSPFRRERWSSRLKALQQAQDKLREEPYRDQALLGFDTPFHLKPKHESSQSSG